MSLIVAEILFGLLFVMVGSSFALNSVKYEQFLRKFMRSNTAGNITFIAAGIWFLYNILQLGVSDFGEYKYVFFVFFSAIIYWTVKKIKDFLSIRGISILFLLIASYLLKAAFLQPYYSRLIMVTGVYIGIIFAMMYGVYPYKFRDHLDIIYKTQTRARYFGIALNVYGLLNIFSAVAVVL